MAPTEPASTTRATTTALALPELPLVSTGWSVEPGDVIVAGDSGVHVVRSGVTIANPVMSPVESAFADGDGRIVILTPEVDRYPAYWPDPYGGGGSIWRISPDGSIQAVCAADAPSGASWGTLNLYQVDIVAAMSSSPVLTLTRREPNSDEPYAWDLDRVWVLRLDATSEPTRIPAETPGEGGVTGLGWYEDTLVMATESDGGASLSMWSVSGDPLPWPRNPVDEVEAHLRVTTIPGTSLIAYTDGRFGESVELVIYDLSSGAELSRVPILDANTHSAVKLLHANRTSVAISSIAVIGGKWVHQGVLVYDLATGTLIELRLEGVATLVE